MATEQFDEVLNQIDLELREDDVGAWVVARVLRAARPDSDSVEIRMLAARVSRALLDRGISLGQFAEDGEFVVWPAVSATDRLLIEWSDLGRDPDIGEVAWFRR
jgi:hypothetical protein